MTLIIVAITLVALIWKAISFESYERVFVANWDFRPGTFFNVFGHVNLGHWAVNILTFVPFSLYLEYGPWKSCSFLILVVVLTVGFVEGMYCLIRKTDIVGLSGAAYTIMAMVCTSVGGWTTGILTIFVVAEAVLAVKSLIKADEVSHFAHIFGLAFGIMLGIM